MIRSLRLAAAIAFPAILTFAMVPSHRGAVWAQLPPPNPLTAPRAVPSAPAPLAAPVQPQGLPSLAIVQPVATATPTPSTRLFNCSCFGPGSGVHWMGKVTGTGYFGARQSATSACLSYNQNKEVAPPVVSISRSSSSATFTSVPNLPTGQPADMAATQQGILPGTLNFSTPAQLQACSVCTCD